MDENKKKLEKIFNEYDNKFKVEQEKLKMQKLEREKITTEFIKLKEDVIRPVMEEFCDKLHESGHLCKIEEDEYELEYDKTIREPVITLLFLPKGYGKQYLTAKRGYLYPQLSFRLYVYQKKVIVHSSNMLPNKSGTGGPIGTFELHEITKSFISNTIMKLIEEVFSK